MPVSAIHLKPAPAAGLEGVYGSIERYYSDSLRQYGATPRGVDWESQATQQMRFVQLLKVCDWRSPFSLNDLGCGYGALLALLAQRHPDAAVDYLGIDLSPAMVACARRRWARRAQARFTVGSTSPRIADFSVASGIFNVKLDVPLAQWRLFVRTTLRQLHATSLRGFSVNFLAAGAAGPAFAPELFATDPATWTAFCRRQLGARVTLVRGYGMREFTLLVHRA